MTLPIPTLQLGSSLYQPVDNPTVWPHLHGREATEVERDAVTCKLAQLSEAAAPFLHQVANESVTEHSSLSAVCEAEAHSTLTYFVPSSLADMIRLLLVKAQIFLVEGESEAAVAHLRVAEVLTRLVNGWGQAEFTCLDDTSFTLEVGEKTNVTVTSEVTMMPLKNRLIEMVERTIS